MGGKSLGLFVALVAFIASSYRSSRASEWTDQDWLSWRDRQIERIFSSAGLGYLSREDVIDKCAEANTFAEQAAAEDPGVFDRNPGLANFLRFIKAQALIAPVDESGRRTHALGLSMSDRDYWPIAAPEVELPDLLRSQPFLEAVSNPSTAASALAMIDRRNDSLPPDRKWIVVPFRTQFILSSDSMTYGRILVVVPNVPVGDEEVEDRWIMFAVATPDQVPTPKVRSVSVVAVRRDSRSPGVNRAFLVDFYRELDGQIRLVPTMMLPKSPSNDCYDCHKTAVIPIHPKQMLDFKSGERLAPLQPEDLAKLEGLNRRIRGYGKSSFPGLDTDAYGPTIGATPLVASGDRVLAAMNCAKCHDAFAKINYISAVPSTRDLGAFERKEGLVQSFVEEGYMPPNANLTPQERHTLWQALQKNYFDLGRRTGALIDWLRGG